MFSSLRDRGAIVKVLLLCLLFGLLWLGHVVFREEGPMLSSNAQALDAELSKTRLYQIWKERYPEDYRAFLIETDRPKPAGENEIVLPESIVRLQRYLPYADDASLLRFADFTLRQYRALETISPIQCTLYMLGDAAFDRRLLTVIEANDSTLSQKVMEGILADVLAGSDLKRPVPSAQEAAAIGERIDRQAKEEEESGRTAEDAPDENLAAICSLGLLQMRLILDLPPEEASAFLRYAFYQAFVVSADRPMPSR